jgi:hypothetical protein
MSAIASESSESLASTMPVHPLLLALYPVLRLYGQNVQDVALADVVMPLLLVLGLTLIALVALSALLRDSRRAAIIVSAGVVGILGFGLVADVVAPALGDARAVLLIGSVALLIGAIVLAWRVGPRLGQITLGLNVISLVLVIMALVPAVGAAAAELGDQLDEADSTLTSTVDENTPKRDIYHLVLDRYGSESALELAQGIDNSEFVGWLRDQGFQVIDDARPNYARTTLSLGATLSMQHLDPIVKKLGPDSENLGPVVRRIRHSEAGSFLQDQGYEYVHIGSWFGQTRDSQIADRSDDAKTEVTFSSTLYDLSIVPALVQAPSKTLRNGRRHAEAALHQFKALEALADDPGPTYAFAHILLPHAPYVFLEDGTFALGPPTSFETQLTYTNRRLREFLEPLLQLPEEQRPIIILQADEGPYPERFKLDRDGFEWSTASDDELRTKYGILNAMYLPGPEGEAPLRQDLSVINTYPELFRRYFGADIDDQPDRILASNRSRPYDLLDITERLDMAESEEAD